MQDFTVSERVEIGKALEGELAAKAEKRMKAGVQNPRENFPEGGRARDLAAKAAGFGNGKTYEEAKPRVNTQFLTPLRHNPAQPRRPRA